MLVAELRSRQKAALEMQRAHRLNGVPLLLLIQKRSI